MPGRLALIASLMFVSMTAAHAADAPATTRPAKSLQDLRDRYAARKQQLEKEVRSFHNGLAQDDGARVAAKAAELRELQRAKADIELNAREADAALDAARAMVARGQDLPVVEAEIERSPTLKALKEKLAKLKESGDVDQAAVAARKLEDLIAELRARTTASIIEQLRTQQTATAKQVGALDEKIRAASEELAAAAERLRHRHSVRAQLELLNDLLRELDSDIAAR